MGFLIPRVLILYTLAFFSLYKRKFGVPVVAQWLTNPTRNHEVAGSIPGLALG